MKSPEVQTLGSPQASGLSSVAAAACPLEMLCGPRQGLGVLGAADRRLRSHFGVRCERRGTHVSGFIEREGTAWEVEGTSSEPQQLLGVQA